MNPQYSYGTEYYQSHKTIGYQVNIKSTNEADMEIIKSSILNTNKKKPSYEKSPSVTAKYYPCIGYRFSIKCLETKIHCFHSGRNTRVRVELLLL